MGKTAVAFLVACLQHIRNRNPGLVHAHKRQQVEVKHTYVYVSIMVMAPSLPLMTADYVCPAISTKLRIRIPPVVKACQRSATWYWNSSAAAKESGGCVVQTCKVSEVAGGWPDTHSLCRAQHQESRQLPSQPAASLRHPRNQLQITATPISMLVLLLPRAFFSASAVLGAATKHGLVGLIPAFELRTWHRHKLQSSPPPKHRL